MTSTTSRSKPIPVPISIPPKLSKDGSSSNDEDSTNFVGTPYRFDRSNPYEYPIPPSNSTAPTPPTPNGARPPGSAVSPLSNSISTLAFLPNVPSSASSSRSSLSSLSSRSNIPTPLSKPPPAQAQQSQPRRPLHSRLPSSNAMSLKLDMPAPIPPNLIGRNLGSLSPALGLEPGELLTLEKANMLGRRERLEGPGLGRQPSPRLTANDKRVRK